MEKLGKELRTLKSLSLGHVTPSICVTLSTEVYGPSGVDTAENPTLLILTHTEPGLGESRSNCQRITGQVSDRGRDSALQGPREVRAEGNASAAAVNCFGGRRRPSERTKG